MLYKTHFQRHRYPSFIIITTYRVYSSHACITANIQNVFVTSLLKKPINHPISCLDILTSTTTHTPLRDESIRP